VDWGVWIVCHALWPVAAHPLKLSWWFMLLLIGAALLLIASHLLPSAPGCADA
jgi:hypothetical protein